jgi:hypothetical protein
LHKLFFFFNSKSMQKPTKSDLIDTAEKGLYDKGVREKAVIAYFEKELRKSGGVADTAVKETAIRFGICERTIYKYIKLFR